jgi:hypothetical protein
MKPEYIASDLELRSRSNISALVNELSHQLVVLFDGRENGKYLVTFSTISFDSNADKIANRFCKVIEKLSRQSRIVWNKCLSRHLDMGFHSGHGNKIGTAILNTDTVGRLAKLKISIAVSVYPIMNRGDTSRTTRSSGRALGPSLRSSPAARR